MSSLKIDYDKVEEIQGKIDAVLDYFDSLTWKSIIDPDSGSLVCTIHPVIVVDDEEQTQSGDVVAIIPDEYVDAELIAMFIVETIPMMKSLINIIENFPDKTELEGYIKNEIRRIKLFTHRLESEFGDDNA